jgi:16S rRNA (guanine966-N2)-methyltransferase
MRIITGKFRGKRLAPVKGGNVRPTSDRVKGSVFSIIRERVVNADFLDLCAGTGNIGLEALSRGAKSATFIERDRRCIRVIEANLEGCGLHRRHPQVRLIATDARKGLAYLGKRNARFDLVYLDPPYDAGIYDACLTQLADTKLLSPNGLIVVEHRKGNEMPRVIAGLAQTRREGYGDTVLSFYGWNCEASPNP